MRKIAFIFMISVLAGCAAPPPVKIASHLIGHGLLKKAKDEVQTSDTTQTAPQQ